jgi:uncharacterized membrane protein YhaH (DUF805 family)
MDIYVSRSGSQEGPFSLNDVNEFLRNGIYCYEDYAWHEGLPNWVMVREIAGIQLTKHGPTPFINKTDPINNPSRESTYTSSPQAKSWEQVQSDSKGVTFSDAIKICFAKYAIFDGRASRSEYWWFYLFTVLLNWGASLAGSVVLDQSMKGIFGLLVSLVVLLPSFAVGARRLHDTSRSGWWLLLALTCVGIIPLIVWMASVGDKKTNAYGPEV